MITFRNATIGELDDILEWAAREGWNPGLDDAKAFFAADPQGFFVAVDQSDTPVAAISVVTHSNRFAFLGLYIVRPELRGQGVGLALWTRALHHAGDRTVGLDGVEAQQDNYIASGFARAGGTTRFSGRIAGRVDPKVRMGTAADIPALILKEAEASSVAKPAYLQSWFTQTRHRTTLVIDGPAGIAGMCTLRICRSGAKIGPLVADTAEEADRLIQHAAHIVGGPLMLDVPDAAAELRAICKDCDLDPSFQTARMYRGPFVASKHPNYAVASLELG